MHMNESCPTHESIMIHVIIYLYDMTGLFPNLMYFPDNVPVVGRVCVCVFLRRCLSTCMMFSPVYAYE